MAQNLEVCTCTYVFSLLLHLLKDPVVLYVCVYIIKALCLQFGYYCISLNGSLALYGYENPYHYMYFKWLHLYVRKGWINQAAYITHSTMYMVCQPFVVEI